MHTRLRFLFPCPQCSPGSAFNIVTPRKSPIRSKANSANGSTQLSTGSAKNASDVPAQSDGSASEVDSFKYNVSVKAQSNNGNSDVYAVRVWVRRFQNSVITPNTFRIRSFDVDAVAVILFEAMTVSGGLVSCSGFDIYDSDGKHAAKQRCTCQNASRLPRSQS